MLGKYHQGCFTEFVLCIRITGYVILLLRAFSDLIFYRVIFVIALDVFGILTQNRSNLRNTCNFQKTSKYFEYVVNGLTENAERGCVTGKCS